MSLKQIRIRMDFPLKFNSAFSAHFPTLSYNTYKMYKKEIIYVKKNYLKDSNQNHKIQLRFKRNFILLFEFAKSPESKKK
jgi:hypothetical protein